MLAYDEAITLHQRLTDGAAMENITLHILRSISRMMNIGVVTNDREMFDAAATLFTRHFHSGALMEQAKYSWMADPDDPERQHFLTTELVKEMYSNPEAWSKRIAKGYTAKVKTLPTVWVSPSALEEARDNPSTTMPSPEMIPFPEGCVIVLGETQPSGGDFFDTVHGLLYWPVTERACFLATLSSRTSTEGSPYDDDLLARAVSGAITPDMLGTAVYGGDLGPRDDDPVSTVLGESALCSVQSSLTADIMNLLTRESTKEASVAVAGVTSKDAKRAAKKAGIRPEVNVIYMRDEKTKVIGGSGEGGHVSRHKVRAHWRWQPYGPGRKLRRWQLIPAHERGSGELDERPKVYVEGRA